LSESFDKLRNRILSDAKVKAENVIKEAEVKTRQIIDNSKADAKRDAEAVLSRGRLDAAALRRSILSSKVRANRLKLLEEKNRLLRTIFSTVEEKLSSISKTPEFKDSLKKMVTEAVEALDVEHPIVKVGFNDFSSRDLASIGLGMPRGAKVVVESNAIDDLGGVVASDEEGKVSYNNSFRARMDRLDSQLLALISSTVFGE
jgi:vacuolar-type H+-ATPase subunit E/Vma4